VVETNRVLSVAHVPLHGDHHGSVVRDDDPERHAQVSAKAIPELRACWARTAGLRGSCRGEGGQGSKVMVRPAVGIHAVDPSLCAGQTRPLWSTVPPVRSSEKLGWSLVASRRAVQMGSSLDPTTIGINFPPFHRENSTG